MKQIKLFTLVCVAFICCTGCVKEDFFNRSSFNDILYFTLPGQSGNTIINRDSLTVLIKVGPGFGLTNIAPDSVRISAYATLEPGPKTPQNFSRPVKYTVRAEDGAAVTYTVRVEQESANPQLENSSLDDWYTPSGKNYQEPGSGPSTIWASGNAGVVTISTANTLPLAIAGSDRGASLQTKDLGSLGQLAGQRMAAATLFTGQFILDISNPLNSTKFGIPFTAKPLAIDLQYAYEPGTPYRDNKGNILAKEDSCDIYLLLENRSGTPVKRIATGWFRSGKLQSGLTNLRIVLTYGPLPTGSPNYQLPTNGQFGAPNEPITHLTFVAASSAAGASYEGGTNSRLVVNNLQLVY